MRSTNSFLNTYHDGRRLKSSRFAKGKGFTRFRRRKHQNMCGDVMDDDSSTTSTAASTSIPENPVDVAAGLMSRADSEGPFEKEILRFLLVHYTGGLSSLSSKSTAKMGLQTKISEAYRDSMLKQASPDKRAVRVHLEAASRVLDGFTNFQHRSRDTPSLSQKVNQGLFHELESFLLPRMAYHHTNTMKHFSLNDAAALITWIQDFLDRMPIMFPGVKVSPAWEADKERLFEHYLEKGVRQNLHLLIESSLSLQSSKDVRKTLKGHVVTSQPENLILMLDAQLEVSNEILPSKFVQQVFAVCAETLSATVSGIMLKIEMSWHTIGSARYCAYINDAGRLVDLIEERIDENLSEPVYREKVDNLTRYLAKLSMHAIRFLCRRVVFDLAQPKPILTSVGGSEWELDESGEIVRTTIATLKDYFEDLKVWIRSHFYFAKILKISFDLTLQTYVESFFVNTSTKGVRNPRLVAATLEEDYCRLVRFFNGDGFEDYYGQAGFYKLQELNGRLHVLKSLSNIVYPSNTPEDLEQDVLAICRAFLLSQNEAPAILHLAGLRRRKNKSSESVAWLRVIARAKRFIELEGTSATIDGSYYRLPDLRNSPFVHKMRVSETKMNKGISAGSIAATRGTGKLLQSQNRYLRAVTNPLRRNKVSVSKSKRVRRTAAA